MVVKMARAQWKDGVLLSMT